MSEYQYYEFLAIDRPLSDEDRRWLRGISSRAGITTTSFINTYHWGDLKGDPDEMTARCFDAFVYVSNFGYCRFTVRLPEGAVDEELVGRYCDDCCVVLSREPGCLLLTFAYEGEPGDWYEQDDGAGWMASLAPIREALLRGDMRPLYIASLINVQYDVADDEDLEPPPPPGLKSPSAALDALIDFMQIDRDLVDIAVQNSRPGETLDEASVAFVAWLHSLPVSEKNDLLTRFAAGEASGLQIELRTRFLKENPRKQRRAAKTCDVPLRTVGEIRRLWRQAVEEQQSIRKKQVARERQRRTEEQARIRREHLDAVAKNWAKLWKETDAMIQRRDFRYYERAAAMLKDLREAAENIDKQADFVRRLNKLRERHRRKPNLTLCLSRAGLE